MSRNGLDIGNWLLSIVCFLIIVSWVFPIWILFVSWLFELKIKIRDFVFLPLNSYFYTSMVQIHKPKFEHITTQLKGELEKLRTSRATPMLVEDILIEVYGGSRMRLKELASISIPEPRTIVINPWDKSIIKQIEKGLVQSALEFNPILDSDILRIQLPELTQETREKLVKKLHIMLEEERIKLRTLRDEIKKGIERQTKESAITEDDKYAFIEELNTLTRSFTEQIDMLGKNKEADIMRI